MSILKTYDVFKTEEAISKMVPQPVLWTFADTVRHMERQRKQIETMFQGFFLAWMNGEEIPNCIGFEYVRPESSGVRAI